MTSSNYRSGYLDKSCWQCNLKTREERLAASYRLGKLTDVTITFPGHHDTIRAHRFVLAISSPVFERMFYGSLAEGEELKLPEDPPEAFKWLIQYIYFGTSNLHYVSLAVKVYHLAKKYQMDSLVTLCSGYLRVNLRARNLPLILDTAMLHEDRVLLEACSKVITKRATAVFNSSYLGHMNRTSFKHLLQHHFGVYTEVTVFKGLLHWGSCQISDNSEGKKPDGVALRKEIEDFLPYIRFLTMTVDEFIKHVMPTGVITAEECNNILMNVHKVPDVPLPPVCSKKRRFRRKCFNPKKKNCGNERSNCLLSSPHSSPRTSIYSLSNTTPESSPPNSTYNSPTFSQYHSPTPERSRHSSRSSVQSNQSSHHSSHHSSRSSRHSSRSSYHSYRSHHSSRSSLNNTPSPSRSSRHSSQRSNSFSSDASDGDYWA